MNFDIEPSPKLHAARAAYHIRRAEIIFENVGNAATYEKHHKAAESIQGEWKPYRRPVSEALASREAYDLGMDQLDSRLAHELQYGTPEDVGRVLAAKLRFEQEMHLSEE